MKLHKKVEKATADIESTIKGCSDLTLDFMPFLEIVKDNLNGLNLNESKMWLRDTASHGCASGCVSGVIYTSEILALWRCEDATIECDAVFNCYKEFSGESVFALYENYCKHNQCVLGFHQWAAWFLVEFYAAELSNALESDNDMA